jgi:hypothetical protein
MTPREQVLHKLGLRTNPFAPEIDPSGAPLSDAFWMRSLDPRQYDWVQRYYFDLYDWSGTKLSPEQYILGPIGADGKLATFPSRADRAGPLLILISSKEGQTGRTAFANLVLHTIEMTEKATPMVVQITLTSLVREQNIRDIAKSFIDTIVNECPDAVPLEERLWQRYDREIKEPNAGQDAVYRSLFDSLRLMTNKACTQPIVFLVSGGDHYDTWKCIYYSTSALADYIIVQTSKPDAAKTCKTLIKTKYVAHVEAPALDLPGAKRFISSRLSLQRTNAAGPANAETLEPFTVEALQALYEPGKSLKAGLDCAAKGHCVDPRDDEKSAQRACRRARKTGG